MNEPTFDLDDIKFKLKLASETTDYDEFYAFLIGIIKSTETDCINELILIRNNFKKNHKDFKQNTFNYDSWSVMRSRIDWGLIQIFDELESKHLKDDCESIIEDL